MNNCYNTFIENSSPLYPSLRRYPFHTVKPPLPPEGIYQHHHNQPHFFSGSSGVQIPNYASHQRASLFYSDSDRLPAGCSFSDDNSDDCDIEVSYSGARNGFQPTFSREGVPQPGPGYTTDCSLHAASEPEPYSSNAGKLNIQSGTHRFYSDTEGLLDNQKESIYHTPPSPAPGNYSGTRDPQGSTTAPAAAAAAERVYISSVSILCLSSCLPLSVLLSLCLCQLVYSCPNMPMHT